MRRRALRRERWEEARDLCFKYQYIESVTVLIEMMNWFNDKNAFERVVNMVAMYDIRDNVIALCQDSTDLGKQLVRALVQNLGNDAILKIADQGYPLANYYAVSVLFGAGNAKYLQYLEFAARYVTDAALYYAGILSKEPSTRFQSYKMLLRAAELELIETARVEILEVAAQIRIADPIYTYPFGKNWSPKDHHFHHERLKLAMRTWLLVAQKLQLGRDLGKMILDFVNTGDGW